MSVSTFIGIKLWKVYNLKHVLWSTQTFDSSHGATVRDGPLFSGGGGGGDEKY